MAQSRPFSKDDKMKFQEQYEIKGLSGALATLPDKLQEWKSTPINIAVTGSSGTGKSYLINAIRNVKQGSHEAARTGCIETTKDIKMYRHPKHSSICFYDLPGCGTTSSPRATYLDNVKFETYDFFIIVSACRFTEDDIWLANEVKKNKKSFYFCRSKVDIDVTAALDDYPDQSVDDVLETIRNDCFYNLKEFQTTKIYLISSKYSSCYDFPSLSMQIFQNLPEIQAEALAFSMSVLTNGSIEIKKEALENRIPSVSAMIAFKSTFTYRRTYVNDIKEEVLFYLQQFELDSVSLDRICSTFHIDRTSLTGNLRSTSMNLSEKGIEKIIDEIAPLSLPDEIIKFIPFIGHVRMGVKSNQMSKIVLQKVLDWFTSDAIIVKERVIKEMVKDKQ